MEDENSFIDSRVLPDGRLLTVAPLTFGRARLTIGYGTSFYDDGW